MSSIRSAASSAAASKRFDCPIIRVTSPAVDASATRPTVKIKMATMTSMIVNPVRFTV